MHRQPRTAIVDGGPLDVVGRGLACPLRMHPRLRLRLRLYAPVHLETAFVEPCSSNRLGLRTLCPRRCALDMCGGRVLVLCASAQLPSRCQRWRTARGPTSFRKHTCKTRAAAAIPGRHLTDGKRDLAVRILST
jgi:hypothetical protein